MYRLFVCLCLVLCGCGPHSVADFQREGEAIARALTADLRGIERREDLIAASPKLKKHFNQLVALMVKARKYRQQHLEEEVLEPLYQEELVVELKRVYQIEGGRAIMEGVQREALLRLDGFERGLRSS